MERVVLLCATVLALASAARAEPIGIELTATVTYVEDSYGHLGGVIRVGDTITAKYTYESDTPPINSPYGAAYEYDRGPYGIVVRAGGLVFQSDSGNMDFSIGIINDDPGIGDAHTVLSRNNLPLTGDRVIDGITWWLSDGGGTAIDSTALPVVPPVLNDWPDTSAQLSVSGAWWEEGAPYYEQELFGFIAEVTSATLADDPYDPLLIPEPATMALVLAGLAALAIRRK